MGLRHLAIEISTDSVQFTSLNNGDIHLKQNFDFRDHKDYRYKEQLDEFIASSDLKNIEHDEHSISFASRRTTLIPTNVFSESDPEPIFRLCFGETVSSSDIDYNRIPEIGIVNVFEVPMWVKSYFVVRHPRSVIQHESTMLLSSMFQTIPIQTKALIIPYKDHFLLTISSGGKLQFYSVFDYQNAEDIIYHFMFTLQQKELLNDKGDLIWCNGSGAKDSLSEEFASLLSKVADLKNLSLKPENEFIINSHRLCV